MNQALAETTAVAPDVSVLIVSWNTRDMLRDCLRSIFNQTGGANIKVIVVDNASRDGSVDMVKNDFPDVLLLRNSKNAGFAAGNNQGMAEAQGRYVLLLNPDTTVMPDTFAKVISFADAHPEAGVVGCRVLNPDRTLQPTCFMFPSVLNMLLSMTYLYKLFPRSRFFGREKMTWWGRDDQREVDVVTGCFMLVRREAIAQVGLLDERFFVYGEETDWCQRFKDAGWKIFFTPDAEIIHFGGQSSRQMPIAMSLQLRGSILQFIRKHNSRLEYKLACVLTWLFFALRVPIWFVRQLVGKSRREYCHMRMVTYIEGMKRLISKGGEGLCFKSDEQGISV